MHTKEQAKEIARKLLEKDPDHFKKIGRRGGETTSPDTKKRGFGSNRELAAEAGKLGGLNGRKSNV